MTTADDRALAYRRLGIDPARVTSMVRITPDLRRIHRSIRGSSVHPSNIPADPVYYLHTSEDPDARRFLEHYYSLPKTLRRTLPIEAFCAASGVSPLRILELITVACVRLGAQHSTIIAAVNHPRVVEKTVEMALTDEGIEDRNVLHKATGFLPSPKGSQTIINVAQHAQANAAAAASQIASAPPPDNTIRRMVDRFNGQSTNTQPALPPTSAVPVPSAGAIEDAEVVMVPAYNPDDDSEMDE